MSLFQFGFTNTRSTNTTLPETNNTICSHMPDLMESGLGGVEYGNIIANDVPALADPRVEAPKRKCRGKYVVYTDEDRAKIGKYACENGNERARRHFSEKIPGLKESTVRNFKKMYREKLREKDQHSPQPVLRIPTQPRGRPPLMGDLDTSLLKFLKAVRAKGGVIIYMWCRQLQMH